MYWLGPAFGICDSGDQAQVKATWFWQVSLLTNLAWNWYDFGVQEVSVHQAKTHLSKLLRQVEAGEICLIKRGGVPVARLVPIEKPNRSWGQYAGLIEVADDFNEPLPDDILTYFTG